MQRHRRGRAEHDRNGDVLRAQIGFQRAEERSHHQIRDEIDQILPRHGGDVSLLAAGDEDFIHIQPEEGHRNRGGEEERSSHD